MLFTSKFHERQLLLRENILSAKVEAAIPIEKYALL
jgi:hypothetical protein